MAYWGFGELVDELARVRALRAAPPGEATNDPDRGRVFGAALQQFDELLTAAHSVGPASAPLPLFYAPRQAGRAIAAARCADDRWDYRGHGLEVREDRAHIGKTVVKPKPTRGASDAFSVVADATGSTRLTAPVELEVLWASLRSDDVTVAAGLGEGLPRPLHLPPQPYALDARQVDLRLPVEDVYVEGETEVERDRRLATRLASYPAAADYEVCLWDRLALPAEGTDVARLILQWSNGGEPRLIRDVAQTYWARWTRSCGRPSVPTATCCLR